MNTIYIGASNRNLGLVQFALYKERPQSLIEMLKEKIPLIDKLFVDVTEFSDAEKDLSKPETLIYKAWRQSRIKNSATRIKN